MDLPPRLDEALAQPTRARLFTLLRDLRRPTGTDDLAERLGLHPNGVRIHMERLREAGLVAREQHRHGRGRPRDMWTVAPDAHPGGVPPTGYVDLGRWLARVVSSGQRSLRAVEATGRQIGRDLGREPGAEPGSAEASMHAELVSLGFQPQREAQPRALTYRLGNCPYREAARGNQDVVCTLHRGITRGLLDTLAPDTELAGFVPRDPDAAGCLIQLRGGFAEDAVAGEG